MGRGLSSLQRYILTVAYANICTYEYTPPVYVVNASIDVPEEDPGAAYVASMLGATRTKFAAQRLLAILQPHCGTPLTPEVSRTHERHVFRWELPRLEEHWEDACASLKASRVLDHTFLARHGMPLKVEVVFQRGVERVTVALATTDQYTQAEALIMHYQRLTREAPEIACWVTLDSTPRKETPYDNIYATANTAVRVGSHCHLTERDVLRGFFQAGPSSNTYASGKASVSRAATRLQQRNLLWRYKKGEQMDQRHLAYLSLTPEGYRVAQTLMVNSRDAPMKVNQ